MKYHMTEIIILLVRVIYYFSVYNQCKILLLKKIIIIIKDIPLINIYTVEYSILY